MLSLGRLVGFCRRLFQDTQFRALLGGASIAFSIKSLGVAATFVFNIYLARRYGAGVVGLYSLAISITELLTTVGRLGLEQGAVAMIGKSAMLREWPRVKGIFRLSTGLILLTSSTAAAGLYAVAPSLAMAWFNAPQLGELFRIFSFALPAVSFIVFQGEALKGLGKTGQSQFVNAFLHPLLLLLGVLTLRQADSIQSVAWVYTGAAFAAAVLGFQVWRAATPHLRGLTGRVPASELLDTALPLLWVNLLFLGNFRTVTIVLGFFGTAAEVGGLSIALRISLFINMAVLAVEAFCAPKFAALHAQNDIPGLAREARRAMFLLVVGTLPVLTVMLFFPSWLMGLFGPEFAEKGPVLAVLAIGQCFTVATGSVGTLLAMTGRQHLLRNIFVLTTIPHIVLQLILTPQFKEMGSAWAITANTVAMALTAAYIVRKELGFTIFLPLPASTAHLARGGATSQSSSRDTR